MADPLSLAASVAGLISLGIQVTTGISQYLDAVKCRDDELGAARRQNDLLKNTLAIVKETTSKLDSVSPEAAAAIKSNIEFHETSLSALEVFVAEQLGSTNVKTWRSRLKTKAGELHYALDRPKLQQLCTRVSQTQSTLQLAIEGMGLSVAAITHESIARINDRIPEIQATTNQVLAGSRTLSDQLGHTEDALQSSLNVQYEYLERIQGQGSDIFDRIAGIERELQRLCAVGSTGDDDVEYITKTVTRLAAKPAALRNICDMLPSRNAMLSSLKSNKPCICVHRKKVRRKYFQLGSLYLYSELATKGHLPHCPMSSKVLPEQSLQYGLRYTGLAQLIRTAIGISFNMSSGAGGGGIGPRFHYYPTVDEKKDNAFRILDLISHIQYGWSSETKVSLHQKAMGKIVRLFSDGKVSPRAVNNDNASLIHAAFRAYSSALLESSLLMESVQILMNRGVPLITYDIRGGAPGFYSKDRLVRHYSRCTTFEPHSAELDSLAMIAEYEGGAMPMTISSELSVTPGYGTDYEKLSQSPFLAEACGCGPLSMAILAKDTQLALSLLEKHPTSIKEVNFFGHTPLHIAASNNELPRFPFVLQAAKTANLLNQQDSSDQTPLCTALMRSQRMRTTSHGNSECTQCGCSDSVAMLLEAGAIIIDSELGKLNEFAFNIPLRGWRLFLSRLKVQREGLKKIALCNPWAVQEYLAIVQSVQVLDLHALAVYKSLRKHGVQVPEDMVPSNYSKGQTIYDFVPIYYTSFLDVTFQLRFQDIDFDVCYGIPPLCKAFLSDRIGWLIQHGADLERQIWSSGDDGPTQQSGVFSAHYVLYKLSQNYPHILPTLNQPGSQDLDCLARIMAAALPIGLSDSCQCACSTAGCTPFVYMLKAQEKKSQPGRWLEHQPPWLWLGHIADNDFTIIFRGFSKEIIKSLYLIAMRFIGFLTLGLTHTCCGAFGICIGRRPYKVRDQDEVEEIQQEEMELIKVLDTMVDEFQDRIDQVSGGAAQLQACWQDYWTNRVPEVLQELEDQKMTQADRQNAELIGVVWEDDEQDNEPVDKTGNPYEPGTSDYWCYELDSI